MTVGYGATYQVPRKGRLATIAVGYADGYPRALGNRAKAVLVGESAPEMPVVGRVSMDLVTLDVSEVSGAALGDWVELIGVHRSLDQVAAEAGTIGYEILTGLGTRIPRIYRDEAKPAP